MTLFYPANNLAIMDYNRLLKSLNGMTSKQFIDKVSVYFDLKELPKGADTKPGAIHKFSLHIDHKWYSMVLKSESLKAKSAMPSKSSCPSKGSPVMKYNFTR